MMMSLRPLRDLLCPQGSHRLPDDDDDFYLYLQKQGLPSLFGCLGSWVSRVARQLFQRLFDVTYDSDIPRCVPCSLGINN